MPVPILLYHHIGEPPPLGVPYRSNYVTQENFLKQMSWLRKLGYHGLALRDAMPYITQKKQGKVVAITFDDGFQSVHEKAMPILDQYRFSATNFFVTGQIGGQNEWDGQRAFKKRCMSADEIKEWVSHGHEAGSHTDSHKELSQIPLDEAFHEIYRSKEKLSRLLGLEILSFAYPHGAYDAGTVESVKKAGFHYAVTTQKRRARSSEYPLLLPRHTVRRNDTIGQFLLKCLLR